MRWHVVFTSQRNEVKIGQEIKGLGFEVFLPIETHRRFRKTKAKIVSVPIFPRYLFVRFDAENPIWNQIRNVSGVLDVLCNQGKPLAVPRGFTEKLQYMQKLGLFDKTKPPNPFPPGTKVALDKDGPFDGFVAKVLRVRTADRVDLLIKYLNREIEVNVSLTRLSHI